MPGGGGGGGARGPAWEITTSAIKGLKRLKR